MNILTFSELRKTKPLCELPLRVTFYARVSTDSDEQLNSLENQVSYYEEFIKNNKAWTFVPGYIDEGLSGATATKLEDFQRMLEDGKAGAFDLIITKEITHFARNIFDSIQHTRELLDAGVAVFFQNDNICTLNDDSEFRLTVMAGIAMDVMRKFSRSACFGHQQVI